ncbi:hypothetical protein SAY86_031120 [Trapa natans]|uniref:HP domain-containing protein n=1 Tax=Trapa natans TaxID=22666 RepID=A0AAN7M696_TRANT|nr:hypothetical protein SAY86_031120 [Trapa natans]
MPPPKESEDTDKEDSGKTVHSTALVVDASVKAPPSGMEVWRIENFKPVLMDKSSHGKFFTGDSYIILRTTALKGGALWHDIHYWLGKDTSQDEAGTAAIKTVELDAALGGRAIQYREVQGHETSKFLSYFKPCIMPQEGGAASGFKHAEQEEHKTKLFVCRGKHTVHVPFARSSLNHDDIFILDTELKIFQFNGSNSCIQERAKALEVVQYIKDTYHDGKCDIATIEDGRLMADAATGEFWGFLGGFAPLPRKTAMQEVNKSSHSYSARLLSVKKGQVETMEVESLMRELLDTSKCYLLDCGMEVFVWMGKATSLDERKSASKAAEEYVSSPDRPPKCHIVRTMEGFETVNFRSKFDTWPQTASTAAPVKGRGKVAALLKRQGVNVKGLMKAEPVKEEPKPNIDCTGDLQVWRVNGQEKILLSASEQSKFYSGDCYIFQYSYPGEDTEEYLVGTWLGKKSVEEERESAISLATKMVESRKFMATQARIYEGSEPIQFFSILQNFIVFKGGLSDGYKNHIAENQLPDETYEDGKALFRVQGSGPDNMQAIQVEPVAASLNSSYCFILQNVSSVFTWIGGLTRAEDQELLERQLDLIKPNAQFKTQREGIESEAFWKLLGGKAEYASQKIARNTAGDLHLFCCAFVDGKFLLQVTEIYNFDQDDLMTEDIFILDCQSEIYVWVGQQVNSKKRSQALTIAENFLEGDFLLENLSQEAPVYVIMEGSEPRFFTCFFTWDSMHGDSFQRKLAILKHGGTANIDKPKRKVPISHVGRSAVLEKPQRSRSASFSPDRVRVRGRSPAFNALAANFEKPNIRNLSTPPPMVRKLYPKSAAPDPTRLVSKSAAIASLTTSFEKSMPTHRESLIPRSVEASTELAPKPEQSGDGNLKTNKIESIQEDAKEEEAEDEEGLILHPYVRLTTTSTDPVTDIDVAKRETYLSAAEFKEKFGMAKDAFYKLPKWKQSKLKMALHLF